MKKLLTVTLMFVFDGSCVRSGMRQEAGDDHGDRYGHGHGADDPPMTDTTGMSAPADTMGMTH